jgi:hypothetical protein
MSRSTCGRAEHLERCVFADGPTRRHEMASRLRPGQMGRALRRRQATRAGIEENKARGPVIEGNIYNDMLAHLYMVERS